MRSVKSTAAKAATAGHTSLGDALGDAEQSRPPAQARGVPVPTDGAPSRQKQTMPRRKPGPHPGTANAKKGGLSIRNRYGSEFYRRIGQKGGAAVRDRWGSQWKGTGRGLEGDWKGTGRGLEGD